MAFARRYHQTFGAYGPVIYDPDAQAYFDAVVTAGSTVSFYRKGYINDLVISEKISGTWSLTDDYWLLAGEDSIQALLSLKQLRTATAVSSPTFTTDRGYTGNGSSSYINTGFDPSTDGVALTAVTSARLACYSVTTSRIGCQTSASSARLQFGRAGSNQVSAGICSSLVTGTSGAFTNPVGLASVSRNGSTVEVFHRGVSVETLSPTLGSVIPGFAMFILAVNNNGSAASFVATQSRFACVGAAMNSTQELAQYNNVQTFMTAVGADL